MIIIVEGPDNAGKGTLIEKMIKKFPGVLIKITDRPMDSSPQQRSKIFGHYQRVREFMERNPKVDFILDRYYPSEMVYSVKRGYDATEDINLNHLEEDISKIPHLLVFCNPGKETLKKRMETTGDDYVTTDENLLMLGRYQKYFENTKLEKIELDTSRSVVYLLGLLHTKINFLKNTLW